METPRRLQGMLRSMNTPPTSILPTLPPGPAARWWGLPLLRAMRADYLGFVADLQRQHGDITYMRLGAERAYDLMSPELVRQALVDQAEHLVRWERGIEVFEQVFGQSVLVTEGALWQRQRRMLMPAFTPKRVAAYAQLMRDAATEGLDGALPAGQHTGVVGMDALFSRLAMDVILRTLFSTPAGRDADDAALAVQTLSQAAMREMFLPFSPPTWWPSRRQAAKRRALALLKGLVGRHIEQRRIAPPPAVPPQDLLAMLLALRDETTGEALSQQEVFDQCMVSFQAGHETSATALLWWSQLMASHTQAAQRAQAELETVLAGRAPEAADLPALPWLGATLKEAMRLYPPVAALMTRRVRHPIRLGAYEVPAGAMLRITPWQLQRDARLFPQPEAFRPERFLPDAPATPRGAWQAFGTGPRVCLGQHFATLEMTLIAALLLQRYRLATVPGEPAPQVKLNVTLRPREPIRLCLTRRN